MNIALGQVQYWRIRSLTQNMSSPYCVERIKKQKVVWIFTSIPNGGHCHQLQKRLVANLLLNMEINRLQKKLKKAQLEIA
jgi:hypothetical protein